MGAGGHDRVLCKTARSCTVIATVQKAIDETSGLCDQRTKGVMNSSSPLLTHSDERLMSSCSDGDKQLHHRSSEHIINSSETGGDRQDDVEGSRFQNMRNNIGFWILGLTNNYAYVVMLSAAFDILSKQMGNDKPKPKEGFHCNEVSTGAILLADILPALFVKVTAPFYMQRINYHLGGSVCRTIVVRYLYKVSIRVAFVVLAALSSFVLVAMSPSPSASVFGVVCASLSSGLGEITFLSYASYFHKDVISAWSSGTGAAGVFGAVSYTLLRTAGLSSRNSILVMLVVPVLLAASFWSVLKRPRGPSSLQTSTSSLPSSDVVARLPFKSKLRLIQPLVKIMIPLFAVYVAEYTINQGLYEMVYFDLPWLSQADQYRWFQVTYQIGVFLSRSSASVIRVKNLEVISALQYVVFILLTCQVAFRYLPSVWFALLIILIEGLFGGAVYVNSFFNISEQVSPSVLEYSMGVVSMADSAGIALAGLLALPLHNYLCDYVLAVYGNH